MVLSTEAFCRICGDTRAILTFLLFRRGAGTRGKRRSEQSGVFRSF